MLIWIPKFENVASIQILGIGQKHCGRTKKSHEKLSKGPGKFVRALRMKRRRVLFGIADRDFERYLLLITDMLKISMSERTSENRASPGMRE